MRIKYSEISLYDFDFIGDVHGCYSQLCSLLEKMGYSKDLNSVYSHPTRKAFFLGDIVDGGADVVKTFKLVKSMTEQGHSFMIMGNHEINLWAINTKSGNSWLRPRTNSKLKQCHKSLDLILAHDAKENMAFLKSLPFYVETSSFRAIHACWDKPSIKILDTILHPDKTISEKSFYEMFSNQQGTEYDAMEKALKGLEVSLPEELSYTDKYGKKRDKARFIWWDKNQDIEFDTTTKLNISLPKYNDSKIVFFGHYWRKGVPSVNHPYALCLDYSAMAKGVLTAYRHNKEDTELHPSNIVF